MLFQLRPAHRKIALAFGLVSMLAAGGCAEIIPASPEQIHQLAEKRADLEEAKALVEYQKQRKKEVQLEGIDPDSLDNVEPLKLEPRWQTFKVKSRENKLKAAEEQFQGLAANVVSKCQLEAKDADDLDKCVKQIPEATYDPIKVLAGAVAAAIAALGLLLTFRFVRKRTDPVAQAGEQLRLAVTTSQKNTVCTGEHGGFSIKVETSAPEVGEGDRFIRVLILSKIDPNVVVRFGPLAPPTGLDLPDLEAPEVPDRRLPEGYKLRLSQGSSADDLLQGDLGFQLSSYDPIDVRVHDGLCGVTCWQVPQTKVKVIEFIDMALSVARLYAADRR
jgi:hypothetical protein